ncbi:hypothetical protein LQ327_16745 [Actinomycetospora endophytica]|uniref:Uncharacterized protein n=1 Tax=Actinomycetospora endophytica TaxID=2291215 RepID=A0ABS8P9S5_9PSEU|nr:hypothetical protein [Actinomycetospora endophytica]MCD2195016.1 hypothetical protein [Actinomycetospora endophytica]
MDQDADPELAELLARTEEATTAFMRGEMDRYLELTGHVEGFTLCNPGATRSSWS